MGIAAAWGSPANLLRRPSSGARVYDPTLGACVGNASAGATVGERSAGAEALRDLARWLWSEADDSGGCWMPRSVRRVLMWQHA
jgi:hypothetical protein